jgi:hypothetical protein
MFMLGSPDYETLIVRFGLLTPVQQLAMKFS